MDSFAARDLRTQPKNIWKSLYNDGEVIITKNGHPMALMLDLSGGRSEEVLEAVRQAKAMIKIRDKAAKKGLSGEEIEREIEAYRKAKRRN